MVLSFQKTLSASLKTIQLQHHKEFLVHQQEIKRTPALSDELIALYGTHKWAVVDLLNQEYSTVLSSPFDLSNWLHYKNHDEVAYFLNEAGSNVLSYSEFLAPYKFHLWLGKKGFIIGIEQKGKGFNAEEVNEKRMKDNEGAAFKFYRNCKSTVFFDDPKEARVVFMEYIFL